MTKTKIALTGLALSASLFAQNISVSNNWQLLGAVEDINASIFDGKCVDFVWKFNNNGWQVHIANNHNYTLPSNITEFNSLNKGEGFWIKGNGSCDIKTQEDSNQGASKDIKELLSDKSFYAVLEHDPDNDGVFLITFNNDLTEFQALGETHHIKFTGNKWEGLDDTDGSYTIVTKNNNEYITFTDYLSDGTVEGVHRLYFDKSKADEYLASLNSNDDLKFTTNLLSANPWYVIEYTDTETYCNGKFSFDENYNLTVSWLEDDTEKEFHGSYSIEDGKMVSIHDNKKEIEKLISKQNNTLTVEKKAYDLNTNELKHTMMKKYFKNKIDAVNFGEIRGVDCTKDLP